MNRLKHKLKSQNGASMLIALLFFLLCSMIGSSILMASVSNAGKSNSNEEQHQIYLALSSAVKLVCDDIVSSEYHGNYTYNQTEEEIKNNQGQVTGTFTKRYFTQNTGEFTGSLSSILLSDLDAILARQLKTDLESKIDPTGDGYYGEFISQSTDIKGTHFLTVKPQTDTYLDDMKINIELEMKETYAIYLTATYEGETTDDNYKVYAELTPIKNVITVAESQLNEDKIGTHNTASMKWKLGWITTEKDTTT